MTSQTGHFEDDQGSEKRTLQGWVTSDLASSFSNAVEHEIVDPVKNFAKDIEWLASGGKSKPQASLEKKKEEPQDFLAQVTDFGVHGTVGAVTYSAAGLLTQAASKKFGAAFKIGGTALKVLENRTFGNVVGAGIHDFYLNADDMKGRLANSASGATTMFAFEGANHFLPAKCRFTKIAAQPVIGAGSAAAGYYAGTLVNGTQINEKDLLNTMAGGAAFGAAFPIASKALGKFANKFSPKTEAKAAGTATAEKGYLTGRVSADVVVPVGEGKSNFDANFNKLSLKNIQAQKINNTDLQLKRFLSNSKGDGKAFEPKSKAEPKAPEPKVVEPKSNAEPKAPEPKVVEPKSKAEPKAPEPKVVEPKSNAEPKAPEPKVVELKSNAEPKAPEPKVVEPKVVEPKSNLESKAPEPKVAESKSNGEAEACKSNGPESKAKAEAAASEPKIAEPKEVELQVETQKTDAKTTETKQVESQTVVADKSVGTKIAEAGKAEVQSVESKVAELATAQAKETVVQSAEVKPADGMEAAAQVIAVKTADVGEVASSQTQRVDAGRTFAEANLDSVRLDRIRQLDAAPTVQSVEISASATSESVGFPKTEVNKVVEFESKFGKLEPKLESGVENKFNSKYGTLLPTSGLHGQFISYAIPLNVAGGSIVAAHSALQNSSNNAANSSTVDGDVSSRVPLSDYEVILSEKFQKQLPDWMYELGFRAALYSPPSLSFEGIAPLVHPAFRKSRYAQSEQQTNFTRIVAPSFLQAIKSTEISHGIKGPHSGVAGILGGFDAMTLAQYEELIGKMPALHTSTRDLVGNSELGRRAMLSRYPFLSQDGRRQSALSYSIENTENASVGMLGNGGCVNLNDPSVPDPTVLSAAATQATIPATQT